MIFKQALPVKLFSACTFSLALMTNIAIAKDKPERWFEIEVILFSQLGDKSKLRENFPRSQALSQNRKVHDLLAGYLNPDISSLKVQLPSCAEPTYPGSMLEQASVIVPWYLAKSLEEIESTLFESDILSEDELSLDELNLDESNKYNESATFETLQTNEQALDEPLLEAQILDANTSPEREVNAQEYMAVLSANEPLVIDKEDQTIDKALLEEVKQQTLTPEEVLLVHQAAQAFTQYPLTYSPKPFSKNICNLPKSSFAEHLLETPSYNIDGFPVTKVSKLINGAENLTSKEPYLLSSDSLQLKNITTQLRRSRNFRPLLHLGWRQPTFIKQKAIPFHLYAGDNLALDYKTKLSSYQKHLVVSEKAEQNLDNLVMDLTAEDKSDQQSLNAIVNSDEAFNTAENEAVKARLDDILLQFNEQSFTALPNNKTPQDIIQIQDDAITNLISELERDSLDLNNDPSFINQLSKRETGAIQAPIAPLQPWYLDGFFKVHVKKYLHITAELNILNQTLTEQATNALKANQTNTLAPEIKAIRFQQDRRVISGEIHYFDHPYIGMIVQIRKHKRPEPEIEINSENSIIETDN